MNIPSILTILGKDYKVNENTEILDAMGICGRVDQSRLEIQYSFSQEPQQMMDTLVHESLHGIDYALSLELSEGQITRLTTGLLCFMRDNIEFILETVNQLTEEKGS